MIKIHEKMVPVHGVMSQLYFDNTKCLFDFRNARRANLSNRKCVQLRASNDVYFTDQGYLQLPMISLQFVCPPVQ